MDLGEDDSMAVQQLQKQEDHQRKEQKGSGNGGFHVLAVDDSHFDRKLLEKLLTLSSYKVTSVESGDKALEYLSLLNNLPIARHHGTSTLSSPLISDHHHPTVRQQDQGITKVNMIMTDYCMPGMTGYDLLRRLKGSSWKDIPVVIMSSENVPSRINMCLEGGAEGFLVKPVQLSDLKKLQQHLLLQSAGVGIDVDEKKGMSMSRAAGSSNGSSSSKRKAMSPKHSSDRRPKPKELAVSY